MSFVKKNRLFSQIFTTGILRGGVEIPTGGKARERTHGPHDPVRLRSRQYSLDERRVHFAYLHFQCPGSEDSGFFVSRGQKERRYYVKQKRQKLSRDDPHDRILRDVLGHRRRPHVL